MVTLQVFCLLLITQGCFCQISQLNEDTDSVENSTKYLLVTKGNICIYDYKDTSTFQCHSKSLDRDLLFDYDFNNKYLYYFVDVNLITPWKYTDDAEKRIHCQSQDSESSCGLPSDVLSRTSYPDVVDITLDWVHHTLYIIFNNGSSLAEKKLEIPEPTLTEETSYIINSTIEPKYIAGPTGIKGDQLKFLNLQVDPYNKTLFFQLSIVANSSSESSNENFTTVIIKSDLIGQEPRLTLNKTFANDMKFYVDISEQRIYILEDNVIYTYDYNGIEMEQPRKEIPFSSKYTEDFVVFRNTAFSFLSLNDGHRTHYVNFSNMFVNDTVANVESTAFKLYSGKGRSLLYDARTKRRKINGEYMCDRKDCPELCKVLPSGDTCVCRESRAMRQDGLTCYGRAARGRKPLEAARGDKEQQN